MISTKTYTLVNGEVRYTFRRQGTQMRITKLAGTTWLLTTLAEADDALASWHHLRRQGYRPAPRD